MGRSSYTIFMRCYTTSVYPAEVESGPLGNVRRVVVGVQGVALSSPSLQSYLSPQANGLPHDLPYHYIHSFKIIEGYRIIGACSVTTVTFVLMHVLKQERSFQS